MTRAEIIDIITLIVCVIIFSGIFAYFKKEGKSND